MIQIGNILRNYRQSSVPGINEMKASFQIQTIESALCSFGEEMFRSSLIVFSLLRQKKKLFVLMTE